MKIETLKRASFIQHHKQPLALIEAFKKSINATISKSRSPLDKSKVTFRRNGKDFKLTFEYDLLSTARKKLDVGQSHKKINIYNRKLSIIIEDLFLETHSPPRFSGSASSFYTKGYSQKNKYYYRLIIPLEKQISFHWSIEEYVYKSDLGYSSRTGTFASINGDDIYVSIIDNRKDKKQYFLSVESRNKQTFDVFSEKAFAIKNALGYMTGHLAGGSGWFFAYTNKKMTDVKHYYFREFRDTIISGYTPIHTNPYAYNHTRRKYASKVYKSRMLQRLSIKQFSTLCQKLHDSVEFSSLVVLILESCTASLLFMPGGLAIALEQVSDIILNSTNKTTPMMTPSLSRIVRKECKAIIDKYCSDLPIDDYYTLKSKIDQLNQKSNKSRLRAPFDLLDITLSIRDTEIIETRNDFLHGRIPDVTNTGIGRSTDRKNRDLYYASVSLYTILNAIILKWVGFDNFILNYPKIQEKYTQIILDEDYYRKI